MGNNDYIPEKRIKGMPDSVPTTALKIIIEQSEKSICKIECNNGGIGTGFFCVIPYPDKLHPLPVLMTNYHILNEKDKKVTFTLNNNKLKYEISINDSRKAYYSHNYDITIIELKERDNLDMNTFLELDDNIFKNNPNDIYREKSIYLLGYPKGRDSKYSIGILKNIEEDNFTIRHLCQSNPGSSGCPIINLNNNRLIGIHKGAAKSKNWNLGTFIKIPLEEFNKTKIIELNENDNYFEFESPCPACNNNNNNYWVHPN